MNHKTLFDLDALPEKSDALKPAARRWYLVQVRDGKDYALTETHIDTVRWEVIGSFKHQPHLYKTYNGAKRAGIYLCGWDKFEVREWKGW